MFVCDKCNKDFVNPEVKFGSFLYCPLCGSDSFRSKYNNPFYSISFHGGSGMMFSKKKENDYDNLGKAQES